MKQTWLIFLNGVFEASQYEETEEEALAAYRSCNSPPEEGDDLYPGDKPMTVDVRALMDMRESMPELQQRIHRENQFRELRKMAMNYPIKLAHLGDRVERGGLVSRYAIDIESGTNDWLEGMTSTRTTIVKGRGEDDMPNYASLEEKVLAQMTDNAFLYGDFAGPRRTVLNHGMHGRFFDSFQQKPLLSEEQAERLRSSFHLSFAGLSEAFARFAQAMPRLSRVSPEVQSYMMLKAVDQHEHMRGVEVLKAKENKGPKPFRKWNAPRKMK